MNTDNAQIKERMQLAYHSALTGGQGSYTKDSLEAELKTEFGENNYNVDDSDDTNWVLSVNGQSITIPAGDKVEVKTATLQGASFWMNGNFYKKYGRTHSDISSIIHSSTKPSNDILSDDDYLWSTEDSENKVYFWVDSNIMYWWSEANHIMLNENCSMLFVAWNNLSNISGLSEFDSSQVKNMQSMFQNCSKITDFSPLANWNVENVENMMTMFNNTGTTTLDLSKWNTSKVKNMGGMFSQNNNLTTIYASENFITSSVTEQSNSVFSSVPQLEGGSGTKFDSSKAGIDMAHIDTAVYENGTLVSGVAGYFTAK